MKINILILIFFISIFPIVLAECPPSCTDSEFVSLVDNKPLVAYELAPEMAIQTKMDILQDKTIAEDYFINHPEDMNKPQFLIYAKDYVKEAFGYDLIVIGNIVYFNPKGNPPLFRTSGTRATTLENFYSFPKGTNIKVDIDGYIWINGIKYSGNLRYNEGEEDNFGFFDIDKGTVYDKELINGRNINFDANGNIQYGMAESLGGIKFGKITEFSYDKQSNTLRVNNAIISEINSNINIEGKHLEISNIFGKYDGTISGDDIIFKNDQSISNFNYLNHGNLRFSDGRIIEQGKSTIARINGFVHNTLPIEGEDGITLNFCYGSNSECSGNYFKYGDDHIELNGQGFSSVALDENQYFSMNPSEDIAIVNTLRLQTRLEFYAKGGKIQVYQPNAETSDGIVLRILVKAQGKFRIVNGNTVIAPDDSGNIYARIDRPRTSDMGSLIVSTDMRVKYLTELSINTEDKKLSISKDVIRVWDLNTGKGSIQRYTDEQLQNKNREILELQDFMKIAEEASIKNKRYQPILRYLISNLDRRKNEVEQGFEYYMPIFGEVIQPGDVQGPRIRSSEFFSQPITKDRDLNYLLGKTDFGSAAVIISSGESPEFDLVQRARAASLAEGIDLYNDVKVDDNLYVMYLTDREINGHEGFLNLLQSTSFVDYGGISNIEVLSHSFTTGMHFTEESTDGLTKDLVNDFDEQFIGDDENNRELYTKFLASATGTRIAGWSSLSRKDINRIRDNFAEEGGSICYRGCNVGNFLHGDTPISGAIFSALNPPGNDKHISITGAPSGTQIQKLFTLADGSKVWSFFELNPDGSQKKFGPNDRSVMKGNNKVGDPIFAQVGVNEVKSRTTRYWPAPFYSSTPIKKIRELLPDIGSVNSYVTITGIENQENNLPIFTVEYLDGSGNTKTTKFNQLDADNIYHPIERPILSAANSIDELYDQQRGLLMYNNHLTQTQRAYENEWVTNNLEQTQQRIELLQPIPTKPEITDIAQLSSEEISELINGLKNYRNGISPYRQDIEESILFQDIENANQELAYRQYQQGRPVIDVTSINSLPNDQIKNYIDQLEKYEDLIWRVEQRMDPEEYRNENEYVRSTIYNLRDQLNYNIIAQGIPAMPPDLQALSDEQLENNIRQNRDYLRALMYTNREDVDNTINNNNNQLILEQAYRIAGRGNIRTRPQIPENIYRLSGDQIEQLRRQLYNYQGALWTLRDLNMISRDQISQEGRWISRQLDALQSRG